MRLYLVRHGQTEENASQIIQGWNPGKLTSLGIEQAERLAQRLKEIRFDAIYSSDSRRAADTARIITQFHKAPIQFTGRLRERNMGVFQGRHFTEFNQAQAESGFSEIDFKPEGGENLHEVRNRAASFVESLRKLHLDQTILLVAHGRWNTMLLGALSGMTIDEALTIQQTNTCVNILECDERGSFAIQLLNCSAHLSDEVARSLVTSTDNG